MDLDTMNKSDLESLQVAKEKEYQQALIDLSHVEVRYSELSREIAEKQLAKKVLEPGLIQGKFNLRRIGSELRNIKTYIYKRLGGE